MVVQISMQPQTGTQAIDRAAQLLVLVVENERSSSLSELADAAGLPKSTVSRAVSALERQGLVQRESPRGAVRPGPVLLRLVRRGVAHDDIVQLCAPLMERMAQASGETIDLAVPVPGGVEQYLAQIDSRHVLGTTNWVGRRLPHHCTAVGKTLLAHGAARIPSGQLEQITPSTITDRDRLAAELEGVRAQGYATAVGELEPGLVAIAAPVLGGDRRAVAAISISGPEFRLMAARVEGLGELLAEETRALSARLGFEHRNEGAP
jgi:IclR family transcriptional regulator, acetate operon repressor